jgi:hypothetical protein
MNGQIVNKVFIEWRRLYITRQLCPDPLISSGYKSIEIYAWRIFIHELYIMIILSYA